MKKSKPILITSIIDKPFLNLLTAELNHEPSKFVKVGINTTEIKREHVNVLAGGMKQDKIFKNKYLHEVLGRPEKGKDIVHLPVMPSYEDITIDTTQKNIGYQFELPESAVDGY